jgi:two-component system NtrC family sensor kinase
MTATPNSNPGGDPGAVAATARRSNADAARRIGASALTAAGVSFVPDEAMVRLIRERDNLFLLHEALAEVERASTLPARLRIFVDAIQKIGFGRVTMTLRDGEMNAFELVTAGLSEAEDQDLRTVSAPGTVWKRRIDALSTMPHLRIGNSYYLDARDPWVATEFHDTIPSRLEPQGRPGWSPRDALLVPVRGPSGEVVATLVLDEPADRARPTLARVRTVELFAQQVASILERARLLEEHRALADRYTRLVESAADAIVTVDERGSLTSVNQALERATGRLRSSLLGRPFIALFDGRDGALAHELLAATLAGERSKTEVRYCSEEPAESEMRSCSITSTPIVEAGRVTGALAIMRDVTDEKRLTEQLMQQEKLAAVGQLVSGVAHELNNPLAGVMAFSQLLLASPDLACGARETVDADAIDPREAIQTIHEEAKRAAKIVANLLTFARQHQPERTLADLNRVVLDTLELRRYALRVRQIEVELSLDEQLPLTWADPFQLQQVVLNLVANAEHALEEWSGERRITIATASVCRVGTERREMLVLRISDTGPGIAPEHLPRIFNPFFTTKPVGEGTGLGLSISDGIVREHDGSIRAEAGAAGGATFIVELPYVEPPDFESGSPPHPPRATPHAQRVLVVDDEPSIRSAVTSYLRSHGHTVDTVGSGKEALALVAQRTYDAILLDLRMPDMPGDALYAELHHRAPAAADRVVFLTGDTQSESARGFVEATGRPSVSKPFLLDELAAVLLAP